MSKRQHDSSTSPAAEQLLGLLKSACDNPALLQTIAEHSDGSAVIAEFNRLLSGAANAEGKGVKRQKKAHNRPRMLNEVFVEVLLFADRDDLDAMQLTCRFMLDVIRERETTELSLRLIANVIIMTRFDSVHGQYIEYNWLPIANIDRDRAARNPGTPRVLSTMHQLGRQLRLAYCEIVNFNLYQLQEMSGDDFERVSGVLLDDLFAQETAVGALHIGGHKPSANSVMRSVNAFKSVKTVTMTPRMAQEAFDEGFFVSLATRSVQRFDVVQELSTVRLGVDAATALAFGFTGPTAGSHRELVGVACKIEKDFLRLVRNKASELRGGHPVDFKFTISDLTGPIHSDDFEQYEKNEGMWVINDLENKIVVEVKQAENVVEIHVFSSA